jgi:hypothetical protein
VIGNPAGKAIALTIRRHAQVQQIARDHITQARSVGAVMIERILFRVGHPKLSAGF